MLIQPDAKAVDAAPQRLSHHDPAAEGGAMINAPDQS
jgi:hypothetical protein